MNRTRLLLMIPAALQSGANTFATQFDPTGGGGTFVMPLYPAADDPQGAPTHYWASVSVTPATAQAIQENLPLFPGGQSWTYDLLAEPGFPTAKLDQLSLTTKRTNETPA